MQWLDDIKLLLKLKKGRDTVADAVKSGWDWRITLKKGGESLLHTVTAILVGGLLTYYSEPAHVQALLDQAGAPVAVAAVIMALVKPLLTMASNYWAHRSQT